MIFPQHQAAAVLLFLLEEGLAESVLLDVVAGLLSAFTWLPLPLLLPAELLESDELLL